MKSFVTLLCVASAALMSSPAYAQEAQDDQAKSEKEIIVQGEREAEERQRRPVRTYKKRRSEDLYGVQTGGEGTNGALKVDWQLLGMTRAGETNSLPVRYRYAGFMAYCAILSVGNGAAAYVDTSADPQFDALLHAYRYRHMQCADAAERASPALLVNAAIAEYLVIRNVAPPPLRAEDVDLVKASVFLRGPEGDSNIATVARCAAIYSPGYAYDVFFTTAGSDEEEAALNDLYAHTPECGLAESPKKLDTVIQRSALAIAMFRWKNINPGTVPEPGEAL